MCGEANATPGSRAALAPRGQNSRFPSTEACFLRCFSKYSRKQQSSLSQKPSRENEVRRSQSRVMARASLVYLGPTDKTEKSGSRWRREPQWKTTTPVMLRRSDACALSAGCPCGPRVGSAVPLRCGGGHGGTYPGLDPGAGHAVPSSSVSSPCPNSDSCPQPGFSPDSGSHSGTSPCPSCSPSREHRDWGSRGRKWGDWERRGSGSTWPEPAAARQPEEGASPGAAARQEA